MAGGKLSTPCISHAEGSFTSCTQIILAASLCLVRQPPAFFIAKAIGQSANLWDSERWTINSIVIYDSLLWLFARYIWCILSRGCAPLALCWKMKTRVDQVSSTLNSISKFNLSLAEKVPRRQIIGLFWRRLLTDLVALSTSFDSMLAIWIFWESIVEAACWRSRWFLSLECDRYLTPSLPLSACDRRRRYRYRK